MRYKDQEDVLDDLRQYCEYLEVDYDILLAKPRYDGKLDDLLIRQNARIGMRINTPTPLYFFQDGHNMELETYPSILAGSEVYVGEVRKGREITDLNKSTIPVKDADYSVYTEDMFITLSDDLSVFEIDRTRKAKGFFKEDYSYYWLSWTDVVDEDHERYGKKDRYYDNCGWKKKQKRNRDKFVAFAKTERENFVENRKKSVESEFDQEVDDFSFELLGSGRYEGSGLGVREEFKIPADYLKKAGSNYILDLGKFIGGQIQIEEKERQRKANIYMDFPKTFVYNIQFQVPDGYSVKGLDKLNSDVSNSTGKFSSTASISGNVITISTTKKYDFLNLEAAKWPEMLAWLDAAYDFSQAKVLLEKQ